MKCSWSAFWSGALLAASVPAHAGLLADLPLATAYAAWEVCTRVMQSGDDFERVRDRYAAPKVLPLSKAWSIEVTAGQNVVVNTWLPIPSFKGLAVLRPGLGCTVVPQGTEAALVLRQPIAGIPWNPATPASPQAWPVGEGAAESASLSPAQRALVQRWSDTLFAETRQAPQARQNTVALLVVKDGHLVHERYAPGYTKDQPQMGWSLTKTLTALWAGTLVGEGRLKLDDPAPIKEWAGTPKAAITWRHLLNMAPGLFWNEAYEHASSTSEMLFAHADQGGFAADQAVVAPPGTQYNYSTGTTAILSKALRNLLGADPQASYAHMQAHLFQPLGLRNAVVEPDATGTPIGGAAGVLRPRDWLRLGQLALDDGRWNGKALVPSDFVRFMKMPSPANATYGGFVRLYDAKELPPGTPQDVFYFSGLMGQYLVVVPSQRLVVLRMGVSFDKEDTKHRVFEMATALSKGFTN
jgi:CubicO group peptidase (beta-lactamase class C family)